MRSLCLFLWLIRIFGRPRWAIQKSKKYIKHWPQITKMLMKQTHASSYWRIRFTRRSNICSMLTFTRYKCHRLIQLSCMHTTVILWVIILEDIRPSKGFGKLPTTEYIKSFGLLQQTKVMELWEMAGLISWVHFLVVPWLNIQQVVVVVTIIVSGLYCFFNIMLRLNNNLFNNKRVSMKDIFTRWGVPKYVLSNGGPQFMSKVFNELCEIWGVVHKLTTTL